MNELIKVTYENDRPTVSGRDLHEKLEIGTKYADWFKRMTEYGFIEKEDYILVTQKRETNNPKNPETSFTDHQLTLDMAKQICMIQRSDAGKRYREYFLEIEKAWNDPSAVMARSLIYANRQLEAAKAQLEEAQPKIDFANAVMASEETILIGDLAKLLKQNGVSTGERRLYAYLRESGYLIKKGARRNLPTQRSMEAGLFEIAESMLQIGGELKLKRTTRVTGKGQEFFLRKLTKS